MSAESREDRGSPFADARRKLVVGTEVLRTGGGATLTSGECHAVLERLDDLELLAEAARAYVAEPSRENEDRLARANLEAHGG